jgi:hypothetical protein
MLKLQQQTHRIIAKEPLSEKQQKSLTKQRGVSLCGLAINIKKYLKEKEELWKLKYFTMQRYTIQKIL